MPLLTSSSLVPHLQECGFHGERLQEHYHFASEEGETTVDYAGFAHWPPDARSACVVVSQSDEDPGRTARRLLPLGAPVLLLLHQGHLHWFRPQLLRPEFVQRVPADSIGTFFRRNAERFHPSRIYHAKTWARFDPGFQLDFVDAGVMPLVEQQIGSRLGRLVEQVVRRLARALSDRHEKSAKSGERLFQIAFWLLAAKILRDKSVPRFEGVDLTNPDEVFSLVGAHYRAAEPLRVIPAEEDAVWDAAEIVSNFSHLGHVTAESLAYLYENTLISRATRKRLGTHSTPSYLVDYIVWQLSPWVAEMPHDDRAAFEPAAGHSAFLVATLRLLRELWEGPEDDVQARSEYLRRRLIGIEIDSFAREISRLSLTIADVPRHNGWQIDPGNMFIGDQLEMYTRASTILLSNPPFERFEESDLREIADAGPPARSRNKAIELFRRTLPNLPCGGVFGIVSPQLILNGRANTALRRMLVREFEISEITLLPDKVFAFADPESVVMIGRRVPPRAGGVVRYRSVREDDFEQFRESYAATSERLLPQSSFTKADGWNLRVPDLQEIWQRLEYSPKLSRLARISKGLDYRNKKLLGGKPTVADEPFPESVSGFPKVHPDYCTHELPEEKQMSISDELVATARSGTTVGISQVLVNYARIQRGPWRLKAVIDRAGHAVTSRFLTLRPRGAVPLEYLWALCNSPLANAFVWSHGTKRDVLTGMMRQMPVPEATEEDIARVVRMVDSYFRILKPAEFFASEPDLVAAARQHLELDAEILRLYGLDPEAEWNLLRVFREKLRRAVPFTQIGYPNNDLGLPLPLTLTLSLERIHELRTRDSGSPADREELTTLQKAIEDFERWWLRELASRRPPKARRRRNSLSRVLKAARQLRRSRRRA